MVYMGKQSWNWYDSGSYVWKPDDTINKNDGHCHKMGSKKKNNGGGKWTWKEEWPQKPKKEKKQKRPLRDNKCD